MKDVDLDSLPYMNETLDLESRINDLLERLTLEEKFKLLVGRRMWFTRPIKRLGINSFIMYDGPHGVRPDFGETKATRFPSAICKAATWDPELSKEFGIAIAQEVRDLGAHMILAPGINIQRTPMCGRTFEYQTEDPYLNKVLAVATVKGVQSQKIAACVKHFICNNQETNRHTSSSEVSERALQEIYFPAFKATVEEADAWSFMSCYNKLNGIFGSEHYGLIRERLMEEWGFRGFVVSDWGATVFTTTKGCMNAGLTLEMPTKKVYGKKALLKSFENGEFDEDTLNDNVKRLLRVMFLTGLFDDPSKVPSGSRNTTEHHSLVRKIAENGIVLLKNEKKLLPLNINNLNKICIIGPNSNLKSAHDGGSSQNFPPYEITAFDGIAEKCKNKVEVIDNPADADTVILCVGLNHDLGMDAESTDKTSFALPSEQIALIKETIKKNTNSIVVLINGSPVSMIEWVEDVPAIIEAWYGGMEAGNAITNVIFGDVNPSGKLPITFPKYLEDSPAHVSDKTYPGYEKVYYEEGIFVGYRHFDTKKIEPLFPFGYGLSYTDFTYENLKFDKETLNKGDILSVSFDILNSGERSGAEVAQLYIHDIESSVERPIKELKGFKKVFLNPGEKSNVHFELKKDDLAFFDESINEWRVEDGLFNVLIGSSSRDIRLKGIFEFKH